VRVLGIVLGAVGVAIFGAGYLIPDVTAFVVWMVGAALAFAGGLLVLIAWARQHVVRTDG
jgi:hypothetical protein